MVPALVWGSEVEVPHVPWRFGEAGGRGGGGGDVVEEAHEGAAGERQEMGGEVRAGTAEGVGRQACDVFL